MGWVGEGEKESTNGCREIREPTARVRNVPYMLQVVVVGGGVGVGVGESRI